jgi:ComF family protein
MPAAGFVRVGEFSGALAELVRAFKFQGRDELERRLGTLLGDALRAAPWRDEIDALTWVPTCWQHRWTRRAHAATALAPHAARRAARPLRRLLRRVSGGRHQVGLPRRDRLKNVEGCFRIARGVGLDRAVIGLIDDVATTGATVVECARVLKRAGARRVYVAILAHAGGLPELPHDV